MEGKKALTSESLSLRFLPQSHIQIFSKSFNLYRLYGERNLKEKEKKSQSNAIDGNQGMFFQTVAVKLCVNIYDLCAMPMRVDDA